MNKMCVKFRADPTTFSWGVRHLKFRDILPISCSFPYFDRESQKTRAAEFDFSGYKNARGLGHVSFEKWDPYLHLEYKNFSVRYQGAET